MSSIYMTAVYKELRKSDKNWEKVIKIGKNWEKVSARSTGQQYFNDLWFVGKVGLSRIRC